MTIEIILWVDKHWNSVYKFQIWSFELGDVYFVWMPSWIVRTDQVIHVLDQAGFYNVIPVVLGQLDHSTDCSLPVMDANNSRSWTISHGSPTAQISYPASVDHLPLRVALLQHHRDELHTILKLLIYGMYYLFAAGISRENPRGFSKSD